MKRFIDKLEGMGELIRVKEYVNPLLEMAEITDRITKQKGGGKAILFENTGTDFPVLTNMFGSERRMAAALGVEDLEQIPQRIERLLAQVTAPYRGWWEKLALLSQLNEAKSWMPKQKRGPGQCQEVVFMQPDLLRLPILKCWPHDGGRFITLPMVHTIDPDTGHRNVGMYRMQVFSVSTTGMHWHKHKTGARHFASRKTSRFPVAISIGGDPIYSFCAAAPMPDGFDEYILAGFLRNRAVTMVPCLTVDLSVPSDCDFVLEGYIESKEGLALEGPFGDHTGFYSLPDLYPTVHITCLTHKKGAVYPATITGVPPQEDAILSQAIEKIFLAPFKLAIAPEVVDIHLPVEGVTHNIAVIKIRKTYSGQAIKIAHAIWGAGQMMCNKIVIVVDDDIDIRDRKSLLDTLVKHYQPTRDTFFSRGPLDVLDHAAPKCGFGGKICLDATKKNIEEEPETPVAKFVGQAISFVHAEKEHPQALIEVLLDQSVDLENDFSNFWLMGSNADPIRDMRISGGALRIDARTKIPGNLGVPKFWPNIVTSSPDTIRTVNERWNEYCLGKFIPSPSLHYLPLVNRNSAIALSKEDHNSEIQRLKESITEMIQQMKEGTPNN
ncbi:MAG: menaquinone biosynthesis decarboxylase [Prevotellaceae bacterium]|jgi:4-hydroxy-3-polyprenylbenzoate decarboxylase|nr:menaquinone biosynthesis decarboxylase [Prevotellaceae bacterium]